ncbi:CocE/NonD family hydrolase [Pendulispora albinea]|uniref:CocE/NonD family hydrolase n=1 Tax=Pendulispora albinea TaxID=2741071 RepID=A0ABZ2LRY4_9BACT
MLAALGLAACAVGAPVPEAIAQPRKSAAPSNPDSPLIAAEIKDDDVEIAAALREHYTKYEYRVPVRDGVRLFTTVYIPKDASRTYPMLMLRTPYGAIAHYGVDHFPDGSERGLRGYRNYIREGYILVSQDVRGRYMSEGTFVEMRPHVIAKTKGAIDESTDTYDSIDWLVKNVPSNNGKVGLWGVSYPGFYAAAGMIDAHPALKAVSPQAPISDSFTGDDIFHNGAFFAANTIGFAAAFGKARPKPVKTSAHDWEGLDYEGADIYDFYLALGPLSNVNARHFENKIASWNDIVQHNVRDDFWKASDPRPHYKNVKPAVMTVGGWFDAEDLFGALETYRAVERQSPGTTNTLVMGPWRHGGWWYMDGDKLGDVSFGAKTGNFYRDHIEFPFFQRHLKGKQVPPPPEAWVFETGANVWQRYASWPPPEAKPTFLAFHTGGKLSAAAVGASEDLAGFDAYISDPAKPVPYRDRLEDRVNENYMIEDQRFASRRPDVLTYSSGVLEGDVTLAGPIEADLWVSTTGTDADFIVKLVDVYPQDFPDPSPNPTGVRMGGYQQLVRGEVIRGKFRNSLEKPEPFKPGEPARVRFSIPDAFHTFRSGHRILVQVQSSWFPLVDRNPQTFTDIFRANQADFRAATHRIYRTPQMPSGIKVGLMRGKLQ